METVYKNRLEGFYVDMYRQYGKIITWDKGDYVLSILASYDDEYHLG